MKTRGLIKLQLNAYTERKMPGVCNYTHIEEYFLQIMVE